MKTNAATTNGQLIETLKSRVKDLKSELGSLRKAAGADEYALIHTQKTDEYFNKSRSIKGPDTSFGKYFLMLEVTARKETIYLPISIGSGKVSTGFVYQVEGTAKGKGTAEISSKGTGILKVTAGSIVYAKIPAGKLGTFKMVVEVTGARGKEYRVAITRVNYKLNPNDSRYKRLVLEVPTKTLKFD